MELARSINKARAAVRSLPKPVGFVPTMGALHAGHRSLVERARVECASVIASIFVNPLQFGPNDDFLRYPRSFASDSEQLEALGVQLLFAPPAEHLYPPGFATTVDVGAIASRYEGALRPGHFRGVATVVLKLLDALEPDVLYMGQKDAQQTAVIRRMLVDLNVPCTLVVAPTVREPDGLALSSRNVYLDEAQRRAAPSLYRALRSVASAIDAGATDRERVLAEARRELEPPLREAYLDVVDAVTFEPLDPLHAPAVVIGSGWLGTTRIIDNVTVEKVLCPV
ncbi:MAG TPA: pantoate--beta-alanine ligase [Candidatus Binatia bacterium]|nr:pantoate--beta-alanine ligase [Candidatus Binatia bacterium]